MESIKDPILQIKDVCISYTSDVMAVKHVTADIEKNSITAIMGPSGCGKSTLLRAVNRMHELYKNIRVTGEILLNGENVLEMEPMEERRRIGMVFQRPNPFPTMNIFDNVLAGYSFREDSSSVCASRALWLSSRTSCSWTSRLPRSTRLPPSTSRT